MLSIGSGTVPSGDSQLFKTIFIKRPIKAINYYPFLYHEGLFIWREDSANWGRFVTDDTTNKELTVSVDHHESLVFSVRACHGVNLHLYENIGYKEHYSYLVRLGIESNKRSDIQTRSDSTISVSRDTPGILSCTELRHFWITWYTGQIRLG